MLFGSCVCMGTECRRIAAIAKALEEDDPDCRVEVIGNSVDGSEGIHFEALYISFGFGSRAFRSGHVAPAVSFDTTFLQSETNEPVSGAVHVTVAP
jgi:hypothetical protein